MINSVIAVQLGLSQHTVKRHVANILLKLDLPTRAAAAALMARQATG
jgi:DNA-binding CsgD family transcriptional regulator